MSEQDMRRDIIDLVLWTSPDKVKTIWSFVTSYLGDKTVGIHADADYLIEHGKFLKKKEKAERRASV